MSRKITKEEKNMHHVTRRQWLSQLMIDLQKEIEELTRTTHRKQRQLDALGNAFEELCEIHPPF